MLVGIDEVGRGCLAGPLVVGAVSLNKSINGLKDSKQLSAKKRFMLAEEIYLKADVATLGWVWPHEIDELGLTSSTTLAIERALGLVDISIHKIILDGNYNYLATNPLSTAIVKADNTVPSVSAASIIAKVARDNYMREVSEYFPIYDFASHVGYGTKEHLTAILTHGPCVLHRLTFRPLSEEAFNTI